MYSRGPSRMAEQRQIDQLEPTYSNSVPIRYVALKTHRKKCTIEKSGKKGSDISVLMAQHDDENDDEANLTLSLSHYCTAGQTTKDS